ncbi:very short patch repair endonuclease [Oharaeibacter diazotrophicus]|uniref:Very short patch repair endonuclease n=1 Tax=Oharaeibacter diazotrophicus TaxID=1920512 RepID=A0A4R6RN53_9HYPH|nr:DNA mismatch endonuclease Vsr [Oharaeibacter diazotrophicus]TDP87615.1 T/G mismatch-specific endonuclease [Oharaeibacter diazotrophicus]BBE70441.1 very short patch repair protein [Pleomorphomonas sp. SM30]GLS77184.1 very short patch repair endonuclease [Oharaeibacter diazotrophicus]
MNRPPPSSPERSDLMRRVRRRGTAPETLVAGMLRALGLAYRLDVAGLPGRPDFANRRRRWALFVNGCFWHHHTGCRAATIPKANRAFWTEKLAANRRRDAKAIRALRAAGFRVVLVWECETRRPEVLRARLACLLGDRRGRPVPEPEPAQGP